MNRNKKFKAEVKPYKIQKLIFFILSYLKKTLLYKKLGSRKKIAM